MFRNATQHPTAGATPRRTRRTAVLPVIAALLALASGTTAHAEHNAWPEERPQVWRGLETWAEGSLVDAQVRVDGAAAPLYFAPGRGDRRYLQAFAGRNYSDMGGADSHVAVQLSGPASDANATDTATVRSPALRP